MGLWSWSFWRLIAFTPSLTGWCRCNDPVHKEWEGKGQLIIKRGSSQLEHISKLLKWINFRCYGATTTLQGVTITKRWWTGEQRRHKSGNSRIITIHPVSFCFYKTETSHIFTLYQLRLHSVNRTSTSYRNSFVCLFGFFLWSIWGNSPGRNSSVTTGGIAE